VIILLLSTILEEGGFFHVRFKGRYTVRRIMVVEVAIATISSGYWMVLFMEDT